MEPVGTTDATPTTGPDGPTDPTEAEAYRRRWTVLGLALVGHFAIAASVGSINVGLPSIGDDLGVDGPSLQWLVVGYQLAYVATLLTGGRLGDIFGRRRLFMVGVTGFVLASVVAAAAPGLAVLVLARALQGVAGGFASPQVLALIHAMFGIRERRVALGIWATVTGAAFMVGQFMTGLVLLVDPLGLGWRAAFLVNVPLGLVSVIGTAKWFPRRTGGSEQSVDAKGVALFTATILLALYPLIRAGRTGWSLLFTGLLGVSGALAVVFVRHERRVGLRGDALIDPSLFRIRTFRLGLGVTTCMSLGFYPSFLYLTLTLQSGFGLDAFGAAVATAGAPVGTMFASSRSARLLARWGRTLLVFSAISGMAGLLLFLALAATLGHPLHPLTVVPALVLIGLGQGLASTTVVNLALLDIPTRHAGTASGGLQTAQQTCSLVGVAVYGLLFFGALDGATGESAYLHAFTVTVVASGLLLGAMVLLHLRLPRRLEHTVG